MRVLDAIEGWVLAVSRHGYLDLMTVRGYRHPENRIVVTPYLSLHRRIRSYDFSEVWDILDEVECIGRTVPVIWESQVVTYIDPYAALKTRKKDIDPRVLDLLDFIAPEWAGLTGSWAVFRERRDSDIDLLVYGDARAIYRVLEDLRDDGLIAPCSLEERARKTGDLLGPRLFSASSRMRLLDSCFKGYPYTLRILRSLERESCTRRVYTLGLYSGLVKIEDVIGSFTVPTLYRVVVPEWGKEAIMETWHTRFMELPPGLYNARVRVFEEDGVVKISPDIEGWLEIAEPEERESS